MACQFRNSPSLRQSGDKFIHPGVNEWHISFETVPPCANQGLLLCANGARSFEVTTLSVSAFEILEVVLVDRMLYFIFWLVVSPTITHNDQCANHYSLAHTHCSYSCMHSPTHHYWYCIHFLTPFLFTILARICIRFVRDWRYICRNLTPTHVVSAREDGTNWRNQTHTVKNEPNIGCKW